MAWTQEEIPDQSTRVIFITGATSGIGYEAAKVLATHKAHLVLACRSRLKMSKVASEFRSLGATTVTELLLDTGDTSSVRACATSYQGPNIDVLLLNAGTSLNTFSTSPQGYERVFATNHLGHFLLVSLLFPKMSTTGRIISVSSLGHKSVSDVDWAVVRGDESAYVSGPKIYGQSKLAGMLFMEELNRRCIESNKDIIAISAHPGMSRTDIMDKMPTLGLVGVIFKAVMSFAQSAADGAWPLLMAVTDEDVKRENYYAPSKGWVFGETYGPPIANGVKNPVLKDLRLAKEIWAESEKLVKRRFDV